MNNSIFKHEIHPNIYIKKLNYILYYCIIIRDMKRKRNTDENIKLYEILKYIKKNDLDNVKKLLETEDGKLVVNSFDGNVNPLILSSKKGYIDIIEVLLKNGTNFNLENKEGETAIECIDEKIRCSTAETVKKFIDCKKMLLTSGATIDKPITTGIKMQRLLKLPIKYNNIHDTENECKSWMFGRIVTETFIADVLFTICKRFIYLRPLEKLKKAEFQIFFGFGADCKGFTTDRIVHIKKRFIFNYNYVSIQFCNNEKYDELFCKYKSVLNYEDTLRSISAEIIQKNWIRKFIQI